MAIRDVLLDLGGQERVLTCDLGAWAAIEDRGLHLTAIMQDLNAGEIKFKPLLVLLWAMLGTNGPRPSMEEVGHWVTGENFGLVAAKMGEALRDAFPSGGEAAANPPRRGTGDERNGSPMSAVSSTSSSGG